MHASCSEVCVLEQTENAPTSAIVLSGGGSISHRAYLCRRGSLGACSPAGVIGRDRGRQSNLVLLPAYADGGEGDRRLRNNLDMHAGLWRRTDQSSKVHAFPSLDALAAPAPRAAKCSARASRWRFRHCASPGCRIRARSVPEGMENHGQPRLVPVNVDTTEMAFDLRLWHSAAGDGLGRTRPNPA